MDQPWSPGGGGVGAQNDGGFGVGAGASLHDEFLRNFHDAGVYDFAADLGIIQNGEIPGVPSLPGVPLEGQDARPSGSQVLSSPLVAKSRPAGMTVHSTPPPMRTNMNDNIKVVNQRQNSVVAEAAAAAAAARRRLEEVAEDTEVTPGASQSISAGTASGTPVGNSKKKRRVQRATAGDKSGKGLRHFSMKVCEKVESKGRTTYNEVADELVTEFSNPDNAATPGDQPYDEKNIRRRVYDALNVLMAMNIISKEKKEIQWKGLPSTAETDLEHLRADRMRVAGHIEKKQQYLQELVEQHTCLKNLLERNKEAPLGEGGRTGVQLPFILVQTTPEATVEVEISEDSQQVHFDFNNTAFEIFDDQFVLKQMGMAPAAPGGMGQDGAVKQEAM